MWLCFSHGPPEVAIARILDCPSSNILPGFGQEGAADSVAKRGMLRIPRSVHSEFAVGCSLVIPRV